MSYPPAPSPSGNDPYGLNQPGEHSGADLGAADSPPEVPTPDFTAPYSGNPDQGEGPAIPFGAPLPPPPAVAVADPTPSTPGPMPGGSIMPPAYPGEVSQGFPAPGTAPGAEPGAYPGPGQLPGQPMAGYYGGQYYGVPMPQNGAGTASLITGIASVLTCFTFFFGVPLAIAAVITGVKGRKTAAQGLATNGSSATAGLVMGIITLTISAVVLVIAIAGFASGW